MYDNDGDRSDKIIAEHFINRNESIYIATLRTLNK